MPDLLINDVTAYSMGLIVGSISGWRDIPDRQTPTAPVPPRAGATKLSIAREQPRQLAISGTLIGTSKADLQAKADTLALAIQGELTKLAMPDGMGRHIYARAERGSYPVIPSQLTPTARKYPIELRFTADNPYFLSDSATSVASGVAMPLGTAHVRPLLTLTAAAVTGVTFTLRDNTTATVATMAFPQLTLISADILIVDCDLMTAKLNGANALALLSSASDFFKVDPFAHANYGSASWPSITVNTGTLTVAYRKRWR